MATKSQACEEEVDGDAWAMSHCRFALALVEGVIDCLWAARVLFFESIGVEFGWNE